MYGNDARSDPATLDGLAFWARSRPEDMDGIEWLRRNATDAPVVVEASGPSYQQQFGRVSSMTGLPVTLNLDGVRCLVVGAGPVGVRKAAALEAAGAVVTVIAPERNRPFRPGDCAGPLPEADANHVEHRAPFASTAVMSPLDRVFEILATPGEGREIEQADQLVDLGVADGRGGCFVVRLVHPRSRRKPRLSVQEV